MKVNQAIELLNRREHILQELESIDNILWQLQKPSMKDLLRHVHIKFEVVLILEETKNALEVSEIYKELINRKPELSLADSYLLKSNISSTLRSYVNKTNTKIIKISNERRVSYQIK